MKKIFFVLAAFVWVLPTQACDVCGCASSMASFPGTLNRQSQFSLGYQYLHFSSQHLPSILQGQAGIERKSQEYFQVVSANARYSFHPKWQAVLQVPVQFVSKQDGAIHTQSQGLADAQLGIARYFSGDSLGVLKSWTIMTEYDIELPTGRFSHADISEQTSRYMLPGSGSIDHIFRINMQGSSMHWIYRIGMMYRLNGMGPDNLAWGDRTQVFAEAGRLFETKKMHQWYASLGYMFEHASSDYQNNLKLPFSGYGLGQLKASVQWRKNQFAVAALAFLPVHGKMAEGRVKIHQSLQFQLSYYPKFL